MYFGYIYRFTNKYNGKVYIGQTTNIVNRLSSHKVKALTVKTKFYNSVRKYGWESFSFIILRKVQSLELESLSSILDTLEEAYIDYYDSYSSGYNSTLGGSSRRGYKLSKEYSEWCKQRSYSAETRQKMSASAKGRQVSDLTREKLSLLAKSRDFSKYAKIYKEKRIQNLKKVKNKAVGQYTLSGDLVKRWDSIIEAANGFIAETGLLIESKSVANALVRCCKSKIPSYRNYIWKYL